MPDINLNVLADRMDGMRLAVIDLANQVSQVKDAVQKSEVARATENERLTARSEANKLGIADAMQRIEHKDQGAIARDQQQVLMLNSEEAARIGGDKNNVALIKELIGKVDGLGVTVGEIKSNDRLYARIAGVIVVIFSGYITGHLLHVFP
jgi:hypothetical protein